MTTTSTSEEKPTFDFSFACGGWLKMYMFGVAKFLQQHELISEKSRLIGSSAGALAACGLLLDADFDGIRNHVVNNVVERAHASVSGAFQARTYLIETIEKFGNLQRFEELNESQRLVVCHTALPKFEARFSSSFKSEKHMKSCLLASCCASPIAGLPFKHDGEWIFDGGITQFQPRFDEKTITISPLYCTNADIRPSRWVPLWWSMYPPNKENIDWLFELGYMDAQAWAYRNGLIEIDPTDISEKSVEFDRAWKTSFGRFTGYRALENRVLDAIFMVFVIFLWKPLAFVLMYIELALRAIVSASKAALFGLACKLMLTMGTMAVFASITPVIFSSAGIIGPVVIFAAAAIAVLNVVVGGMEQAAEKAWKDWETCVSCTRSFVSLSLLLRTIPVVGVMVPIKRHHFLLEHSFVYRVTSHFV